MNVMRRLALARRCGGSCPPELGQHRVGAVQKLRSLVVNALRATGQRTAMGRYIERMAAWWSRTPGPFDRLILVSPSELALPDLGNALPIEVSVVAPSWPRLAWEQLALPLSARRAALLFCPSYTCPLGSSTRVVLANHGIYEMIPTDFSRVARLRSTPLS